MNDQDWETKMSCNQEKRERKCKKFKKFGKIFQLMKEKITQEMENMPTSSDEESK